MNKTKRSFLAKIALLSAAFIWGTSFVVMKDSVDVFPTPVLLGIRFTLGCILLCIIFCKKLKMLNKEYFVQGGIIGIMLFLAYYTQTLGLTDTTPGKNAFLTAAYCVIVPFILWVVKRKMPDVYNFSAAFLCLAGVGLVSLTNGFSMRFGDAFTLVGAFFYAAHIVVVARFSSDKDPVLLTILQFGMAAILSWIVALFTAKFPSEVPAGAIWGILYLAFFATGAAMLLQNVGQKFTEPVSASILLSLESVFGVIVSAICGAEQLTPKICAGFVLIFISVIVSETKLSFLRKKK